VVTVSYSLVEGIVAMYDGDHAVSTIPAGGTIETIALIPESGSLLGTTFEGSRGRIFEGAAP
jgi:hypothetical protein